MHKSIFVSSTFRDFQTERNLIQNRVEIQVNEALKDVQVSFVDLRWGIDTTDETGLDKVVSICIEEVLESYPYYIIMLGDSYGSCVDPDVVRTLYAMNGLDYDGHLKSVTEIEIEATGLFRGNRAYVLVLDRSMDGVVSDPAAAALKQKVLEAVLPENVYRYEARIGANGEVIPDNQKGLVSFVTEKLVSFLEQECAGQEHGHPAVAQEEAARFLGREQLIQSLEEALIADEESYVFQIYGKQGTGRTAVMAKLYSLFREKPGVEAAFITGCGDGRRLDYHDVMKELAAQYGMPDAAPHVLMRSLNPEKRYYCFVDDYPGFGENRFLTILARRLLVPDNMMFVSLTEDPQKADFCLEPMDRQNALEIFTQTLDSYKKQIPGTFLNYFTSHIPQEMVESPVFLKYYIASLCYLDQEAYRRLGRSGDFMGELTRLFVEKTQAFPKTEAEYVSGQLWGDGPERWMLGLLAVSRNGLDERTLLETLRAGGMSCQAHDFYRLKEKLREGIRLEESGHYTITHDSLRRGVLALLGDTQVCWLRYLLADYLGQNMALLTYPYQFREVAYQYLQAGDPELLAGLIELQYYMPEHSKVNGTALAMLCEDFNADRPSVWYQQLVDLGNPEVCAWLCRYAMPYLTQLYIQNAEPLFRGMLNVVERAGMKSDTTDDIFSLYVRSLVCALRFREMHELTHQKMKDNSLSGLPAYLILHLLQVRCWQYDTKNVAAYLDLLLDLMDRSASGLMSLLQDLLYSLVLLDGNLFAIRPQLERVIQVVAQELPTNPDREHAAAVAVALRYICQVMNLDPGMTEEALEGYCQIQTRHENTLSYQILCHDYRITTDQSLEDLEMLVNLVHNVVLGETPISTLDLWYLAKFFRRICYQAPQVITREFGADVCLALFDRILNLGETVGCALQLVELCYLCYLGNLYTCGTDRHGEARERLHRLTRVARGREAILREELAFFEEDVPMLMCHLGPEAASELAALGGILGRHS